MINASMLLIVLGISLVMVATALLSKKSNFVVGDRKIGTWRGALSIAATWIWAPALFVSSQQAFQNGWVGFLCFLIPNALCLVIYAPFAQRLRDRFPNGYNFPDIIGGVSGRVRKLYKFNFSALSLLSISVQLLAGSQIMHLYTGVPFLLCSLILLAIPAVYMFIRGFNASVNTDVVQYVLIALASIMFLVFIPSSGLAFNSIKWDIFSPFEGRGLEVLLGFGIPTAIGLLSGPFGDGTFAQRALAIKKDKVKKSFFLSAILFAVVPLCLSTLGFGAVGAGFTPTDVSQVGVEFITSIAPTWVAYMVFVMVLCGLLSSIDSHQSFLASLGKTRKQQLSLMFLLPIISVIIANIPGNSVNTMFLFYGLFRAVSLVVNMLFMWGYKLKEKTIFWAVLINEIVSFVPFAIGNFFGITWLKLTASLMTIVVPAVIIFISEKGKLKMQHQVEPELTETEK